MTSSRRATVAELLKLQRRVEKLEEAISVLRSERQASRHGPRILRLPAVKEKTGLARDTIYRGIREGWFPKQIKLSERASGWREDELNKFIESRLGAVK